MKKITSILLFLMVAFIGCRPLPPGEPGVYEAESGDVKNFLQDLKPGHQGLVRWTELEPYLKDSLDYVGSRPEGRAADLYGRTLTWGELQTSLQRMLGLLGKIRSDPEILEREFQWLELTPSPLLTGYFEPRIKASLQQTADYTVPMYGLPDDLLKADLGDFHPRWEGQLLYYRVEDGRILPYHSRKAIDFGGVLKGRDLEIAWTRDLVDVFFLQIQGSGRLVLPDGSTRHILYHGKNGRRYVSLGRVLVERGYLDLDEVSMESIRRVLHENPEKVPELLSTNPSYVFFRLSDLGPFGSMNKLLTPFVSVATDRNLLPLGSMLALEVRLPHPDPDKELLFKGIVLPQDTGGAIKGHRIDLFCGSGELAEYLAGHLKAEARAYLLLPRQEGENESGTEGH